MCFVAGRLSFRQYSKDTLVRLAAQSDACGYCRIADLVEQELIRRAVRINTEDGGEAYEYDAYHGTAEPNLKFHELEPRDPGYSGSLGPGIYLGQERATAEYYRGKGAHEGQVLEGKVRFKNPLVLDAENGENVNQIIPSVYDDEWYAYEVLGDDGEVFYQGNDWDDAHRIADEHDLFVTDRHDTPAYAPESVLVGESVTPFDILVGGKWHHIRDRYDLGSIVDIAKEYGHDGLVTRHIRGSTPHEEMVAFDPKQLVPKNPLT